MKDPPHLLDQASVVSYTTVRPQKFILTSLGPGAASMTLKNETKNKELPISIQFAAMFFLWSVWLMAVVVVIWRERKLRDQMRYYDIPFIIYQLLFVAFPLVLVVAGTVFLLRVRPIEKFGPVHRVLYYVFGGLTLVAVTVLLSCGIWALSLPWEIIRE